MFDAEAGTSHPVQLIKNYRDFVFQVWPKVNHDAHKEYTKVKKLAQRAKKNKNDTHTNQGELFSRAEDEEIDEDNPHEYRYSLTRFLETKLILFCSDLELNTEKFRRKMEIEREANLKALNSFIGLTVTYGSEIQLMHVDSKAFLSGKVVCSELDKTAYKFELSSHYSSGMVFKIMPRYKVRQEGEVIEFNDQILLYNVKLASYVNFTDEGVYPYKDLKNKLEEPTIYKRADFKRFDSVTHGRYEAIISNDLETTWQIIYHSTNEALKVVKGQELILLRHTELQGDLSADINYNTKVPEVFVRRYDGDHEDEKFSLNSVWEIEWERSAGRGDPCAIFTGENDSKGKPKYQKFTLRHFLTGRVLTLENVTMGSTQYTIPCLAASLEEKVRNSKPGEVKPDPNSWVQFVPTTQGENPTIDDESCYFLGMKGLEIAILAFGLNLSF